MFTGPRLVLSVRPLSVRLKSIRFEALALGALCAAMMGCGVEMPTSSSLGTTAAVQVTGRVHGGQQPVVGGQVYLYAVSSAANGGASTSLLASPGYVTTDAAGSFRFPAGSYTCPTGAYVYFLSTGGNPGLGSGESNPKIGLAAGFGPCSALSAATTVNIDEVTTVATAAALSAYATSEVEIGASSGSQLALQNAFSNIAQLADLSSGNALTQPPSGAGTSPQQKLNTLADILAGCVNSDGTVDACTSLMSLANVPANSEQVVDTFQAALNIEQHPTTSVGPLYGLLLPKPPFLPTLNMAPSDWTMAVQYPATVALTPGVANLITGAQQALTASVSGSAAGSYQWSTLGQAGTLTDSGGTGQTGLTNYCSTSAQAVYVSSGAALSANVSDSVTVQAFAGASCVAANALGQATSSVNVQPAAATISVPGQALNATQVATVVLPAGMNLRLDQLTVVDSLGQVTPSSAGTFTLPTYVYNSQVAVVLNPNGNPILMGWLDSTHQTLSAETTAEVLAFYALGGPLLYTTADSQALEAALANAPGLGSLAQTIGSELAANPDALEQTDPAIETALNQFFTSISGITPGAQSGAVSEKAAAHPESSGGAPPGGVGILIQPGEQSGVFVEQSSTANEIDAVNKFRRRTHVFVDRVSDTSASGQVTQDAGAVTDFELSPTTGLTGGVAGTISDIYNSYWGNTTTAYGPVTSDPVSIPVKSGYTKTTYQVTVVGPGFNAGVYSSLTDAQATAQLQTAVAGFVDDAMIPFLANYIFGSGFFSQESGALSFKSTWQTDLQADMLNFVAGAPALQQQIISGDYSGALAQVIDNIRQAGSLRTLVINSLEQAATKGFSSEALTTAMSSFNTILNAAGGVLQIYDSSIMAAQLTQSDEADQWTVINGGQKVTLTPASTSLAQFGIGVQNLTAALPGVSNTAGYSYYWTNTGNAGDISPADGSQGPGLGFCSSDATVTYVVHPSPILQNSVTDKIFVQAFSSGNCTAANAVGSSPTALVTVTPEGVTLSPASPTILQSGQATLTAAISGSTGSNFSYLYTLTGTVGGVPVGSISDGANSGSSFCSALNAITYTPNATPVLTQTAIDGVTVQAFTGAGCAPTSSLGTSSVDDVTVAASGLLITPHNASLPQTGAESFTATLTTATQNATYSYQWTVAGAGGGAELGTIAEGNGGTQSGASFCSAYNNVNYTPNAAPVVSVPGSDVLSVQAFSGASCVAANSVSGVISTNVTVIPTPTSRNIALTDGLYSVLEASDGNYYGASVDGFLCTSNAGSGGTLPCGSIYQITPSGTVTTLFQFAADTSQGIYPSLLVEGPDGQLYGMTADGVFFSLSLGGTFHKLAQIPVTLGSGNPPAVGLLLGSDGFFYTSLTGGSTIYRIGLDGQYQSAYVLNAYGGCGTQANTVNTAIEDFVEGADGNFYVASAEDCQNLNTANYGALLQITRTGEQTVEGLAPEDAAILGGYSALRQMLTQASDGNFYYLTSASGYFQEEVRLSPAGQFDAVNRLYYANSPYLLSSGLQLASDGNLYGNGQIVGTSQGYYAPPCNSTTGAGCDYEFQMTPGGGYATLYSFGGGSEGTYPNNFGYFVTGLPIQNDQGEIVGSALNYPGLLPNAALYQINNHLPAPIQLSLSATAVSVGQPVMLSWKALDAFSLTAQQCYAFVADGATGAGAWTGKQTGTASAGGYAGSSTITPTAAGTYTYALNCGGRETGFATLTVQ
jgi:hypothetical protein